MALTRAELRERLEEERRINRGLVDELVRVGRLADAGQSLANAVQRAKKNCRECFLGDHPRGSCQCHIHLATKLIFRLSREMTRGGQEMESTEEISYDAG